MNEDMNIPEAVRFLLQQQAQFYTDLQAMREEFATDMQVLKKEVAKVVETVNTIAAAHLRLTESHLQLAEAHRQLTEAHTVLETQAAETEAKLNALIDIVSRQQPPLRDTEQGPPALPLP